MSFFFLRKLPIKSNTAAITKTPTKTNHTSQNGNQSHLHKQETKVSKLLKQKEPLNIKKSLLSKPIVVSKTTAKTESTVTMGPCKPDGLKRPISKANVKLQSSAMPAGHSTPVKDQAVSRRRSVAVSPQRDLSEAAGDKLIFTKQRRRSGIPHFGGMVREYKNVNY